MADSISHYQILRKLGAGGMGEVYLAKDTKLERTVALKILPVELAGDADRMRRFLQEAKTASAVKHANVAHIYEIGESEGKHYIAMEYIEGQTLAQRIHSGPISIDEVMTIGMQIADAMEEAHSSGITHRDIKPANIAITARGQVKVLDFGIAKMSKLPAEQASTETPTLTSTTPGLAVGTVQYMSPEQALGKNVDRRSDLFSIGTVLYQCVTKRLPFSGSNPIETIDAILHSDPKPVRRYVPSAPAELDRIIHKCLEKDRESRYQSARELYVDMKNLKRDIESGSLRTQVVPAKKATPRTLIAAAALLFLGLAAFLIAHFTKRPPSTAHVQSPPSGIHSLAVLPFDNISKNPDTDYLSDGVTESLIDSLAQLSDLTVIARASVFQYKGKTVDIQKVADQLHVQAVLTGRLYKRDDDLSVSAELVDARTNKHLWGEQYNRKFADIFQMQEEIATTITKNIKGELTGQQAKQLAKHDTNDPEAYQLYLQGRFFWNKATKESVLKAIQYFHQAIDKDPTYALAYAGIASCYSVQLGDTIFSPKESHDNTIAAAQKALEIDKNLAEAYTAIAVANLFYDWNYAGAEKRLQRAIELKPSYETAHHQYAWLLAVEGRFSESLAEFKKAKDIDPLSLAIVTDQNVPYLFAQQYDKAIELCQKASELDPYFFLPHFVIGSTAALKGDYALAFKELERSQQLEDTSIARAYLGYTYGKTERKDLAEKIASELIERSKHSWVSPTEIAYVYIGMGDKDRFFQWYRKAFEEHDLWISWIGVDHAIDPVRSDPRFQEILKKVNPPMAKQTLRAS